MLIDSHGRQPDVERGPEEADPLHLTQRAARSQPARTGQASVVLFVSALGLFLGYVAWQQRGAWFWMDEWNFLVLYHDGNFLEPSNGHLTLIPAILTYTTTTWFGLSYPPFQIVGLASYAGLAIAMFLHVSRRGGRALGAVFAAWAIWFAPNSIDAMYPAFFNYTLPLALTIVVAGRLEMRRVSWSSDAVTVAVLAISIACSAVGLLAVVIVVVHLLANRAQPARCCLFSVPVVLWVAWYLRADHSRAGRPNARELWGHADRLVTDAFTGLGAQNPVVGFVLGVSFVILITIATLRWGTFGLASVRWLLAAATFVVLTSFVQTRITGYFGEPARYAFVVATMLLLAVADALPRADLQLRAVWPLATTVIASGLVLAQGLQVQHQFRAAAKASDAPALLGAEAAGTQANPDRVLPLSLAPVTVAQYFDLIAAVGSPRNQLVGLDPIPSAASEADAILLDEAGIRLTHGECTADVSVPAPTLLATAGSTVVVTAVGRTTNVYVMRLGGFEYGMTPFLSVDPGDPVLITFPSDPISVPWNLQGERGALISHC